jgi:predicted metal-binding protein
MKINVKHILEGVANSIFVKEEIEKIANERNEFCKICPKSSANSEKDFFDPGPYYSKLRPDDHCSLCACNLHAKVRSLHTNCPAEKWAAVATVEEAAKIAMITENEQEKIDKLQ